MQEDPDQFIAIGRFDWYVTPDGHRLHWIAPESFTGGHRREIARGWLIVTPVRLACGRLAGRVSIPGLFTRMSALRCRRCCAAAGMPQGRGSPKNDPACRALLGLPGGAGE